MHTTSGRIYQIYNNKGTYSAISLDSNSDTKDTAGSSNLDNKLYLVGAQTQAEYAVTYSNSAVYEESGNLYATTLYANNKEVATKEWVGNQNYLTGISSTTTSATGYIPYISAVTYTAGSAVSGGTTKYAHPSFSGTQFTTDANTSGIAVASSTHTHTINLTSSSNTTGVKYVKSMDVQGTKQYAGATFSGNSVASGNPNEAGTAVASTGHTHSSSTSLKANANTTTNAVTYVESVTASDITQKHLTASFSGSSVTSTAPSATTTVSSSSHTHTASVSLKANADTTTNAITYIESVGATDAAQKHLTASFGGNSVASTTPSATTTVSSSAHTHGASVSLKANANTTTNAITYVESVGASDAAQKRLTASFGGNAVTSTTPSATTTVSSSTHTHSNSVTLKANANTTTNAITYIESVGASDAAQKHLTASFSGSEVTSTAASDTTTVASTGHTHTNSITLKVNGGNTTNAVTYVESVGASDAAQKRLTASFSGNSVTSTAPSDTTTVASSGHTHTNSITLKANTGTTTNAITYVESVGASDATQKHLTASFSGTSATSGGPSGTTTAASNSHTHNVTAAGSVNLTANTATTTGRITYVESITNSAVTASTTTVGSNAHTHTVTATGTISLGATTTSGGTAYVSAVTLPTSKSTGDAAPQGHTHSYDKTTGVTISANANSGDVTVATNITGSAASGDGTTKYLHWAAGTTPYSTATLNTTTVATGNDSGDGTSVASSNHTHTYNTYSLTGSNASGTTKYLRFNPGTTPKSGATPGHTSTNTGNDSGSGTSVASSSHTHTINLTANADNTTGRIQYVQSISSTKASASGTAKAGSETHTHTYDKTTGVTLTANTTTATGRIQYVESATHVHTPASLGTPGTGTVTISGGDGNLVSLAATTTNAIPYVEGTASASGTANVATAVGANGTATVLTGVKGNGSASVATAVGANGTASVATAVGANGTASVVTAVAADGTGTAAPGDHTHTVTVSGTTGNNSASVTVPTATHAHGITLSSLAGTTTGAIAFVSAISGGSAVSPTTKYAKFSPGTTPPASASFTGSAVTSGGNSGDAVAAVTSIKT